MAFLRKFVLFLNNSYPFLSFLLRGIKSFFFGEKEIVFLNKILKKNKKYKFVDIGANTGAYTFIAFIN